MVSEWGMLNYSACRSLNVPTIVGGVWGVGGWEGLGGVVAISFSTAFDLADSYLSGTVYFYV